MRKELDFPRARDRDEDPRASTCARSRTSSSRRCPRPTYVKGFLRTYADYLGLDGQLYVDEYNVRYGSGDEVLERRVRSSSPTRRRPQRGRRRGSRRSVVWLTLVGIAVVTALVIAAWQLRRASGQQSLPLEHARRDAAAHAGRRPARPGAVGGNTLARSSAPAPRAAGRSGTGR